MFVLLLEDYIEVIIDEVDFAMNEMMVPGVMFVKQVEECHTKDKQDTEHAHATEQDVIVMETEDLTEEDGDNDEGENDPVKSKSTKWVCTLNALNDLHHIHTSVYAYLHGTTCQYDYYEFAYVFQCIHTKILKICGDFNFLVPVIRLLEIVVTTLIFIPQMDNRI